MNTLGLSGASVAPAATCLLLQLTGNGWTLTFYASALIYAAGALGSLAARRPAREKAPAVR